MSPGCALYRGFSLEVFFQVYFSSWRLAAGQSEKMQASTCSQMSRRFFCASGQSLPLGQCVPGADFCLGLHFEMALAWIRTEKLFYDPGTCFFKAISLPVCNQFHLPSCILILFRCTSYDQSHLCLLTDSQRHEMVTAGLSCEPKHPDGWLGSGPCGWTYICSLFSGLHPPEGQKLSSGADTQPSPKKQDEFIKTLRSMLSPQPDVFPRWAFLLFKPI